ncbi:PadR family transcriptional regulator [Streptomyces iconiensis]|uniref:PadR family transcriptional regulator n=1 Tax=Streptomyces iconiensis TaxID=1384038 RepID=A0ABT7A782_9ACTN|nr:PadR family transcriptional regulator [Streptomyces iconiensis]MDJ1137176.1 PadR family transcriptional regulator [Streptomyces iconiensis]
MEPAEASNPATQAGKAASQLRKGVLEYCVLALLRDGPRYAVELLRGLEAVELMATSQGTVYPLLSRLRRDELVATNWQESTSGPPRRYYELTPTGRAALDAFAAIWPDFRDAVDLFLGTPRSDPSHPPMKHLKEQREDR